MAVKLITDGSVDLPQEILERYEIGIVPLTVIIDGKPLLSRIEISTEEFYERQRAARELPSTSQPTPAEFSAAFEQALQSHERVLCICISSGLSGTFNSAQQAAAPFGDRVIVHDALTLSGALGFQVVAAARALAADGSLEAALEAARRTHRETELYFALDDLTYLIKGGRIGRVSGTVGSLLNIKPVIAVDRAEGIYVPVARVRSFKATMRKMVDLAAQVVGEGGVGRFMILHGEMEPESEELGEMLRTRFDARWLYIEKTSPALGAHTGPRGLGLVVAPGDWNGR